MAVWPSTSGFKYGQMISAIARAPAAFGCTRSGCMNCVLPIMFLNTLNELAALILVGAPPFLATFTRPQLDSLAFLFLRLHGQGIGVVDVFWSLWLVPFGLLVMRSGFLPRALGVLLLAGAAGAMIGAVTSVLPTLSNGVVDKIGQVLAQGELPIIVWLVFPGAREPRAES